MDKYSNYNDNIRLNYVKQLDKVICSEKISRNIEKSIYNYTINFAKEKNIQRDWNNKIFYKLAYRGHAPIVNSRQAVANIIFAFASISF